MLINCPECGRKVSDQAKTCPNCGFLIYNYIEEQMKAQLKQEENRVKNETIKELIEKITLPTEPQKQNELNKSYNLFNTLFDISIGLLIVGVFCFIGFFSDGTESVMIVAGFCLTIGFGLLLYSSNKKDMYKHELSIYEKEHMKYECAKKNPDQYKKNIAENQYYAKKYGISSKCPICESKNTYENILSKWTIDEDNNVAICNVCGYKTQLNNNNIQKPIHIQYGQDQNINHKPKCPTCGSYDIEKISVTSKAISGAALGVYSNNIRKTFHCKKCGYKW